MFGNRHLVVLAWLALGILLLSARPTPAQEWLCDPSFEDCRTPLWRLIDAETVGIDVAFWYLTDASYVTKLINKHNAGVPVRVIVDPRANVTKNGNDVQLASLQAAGIPMRYKSSPYDSGGIMHAKFMVFAGQNKVEFGSANYSPYSFITSEPYVNYTMNTIYFTDDLSIVNSFKTKFDDLWTDTALYANYANVSGTVTRRYPTNLISPALNFPPGKVGVDYDSFATRTITHLNQETAKLDVIMLRLSDQRFSDALINAFHRGVPVRVMTEPDEYRTRTRLWQAWNIDRLYVAGRQIKHRKHRGEQHQNSVLAYSQGLSIFGSSSWTVSCSNSQEEHNYFTTKQWIFQWLVNQFEAKWNSPAEYQPFVPLPPDQPTNQAPASGAVDQTTNVKLIWEGGPWAHKYDIYFGTTSNPPLLAAEVTPGSPENSILETYQLPPLASGTTYYWRIVGKTMANLTASGPTWSFTTSSNQPLPSPLVQSISPTSGTGAGGTQVTIGGINFSSGAMVIVGGALATNVNRVNSTTITAITPEHFAGIVDVAVISADGQTGTQAASYTFTEPPLLPTPTITSVTPNAGSTSGGTQIIIRGLGFSPGSTVSFGGTPATSVVVNSYTSITATAPVHSPGAVNITVSTPYNLKGTLNDGYTYTGSSPNPAPTVNAISPNSGSTSGGESVTITGTGFLSGATVSIGGIGATNVAVINSTSITASTPAHAAGTVSVVVTNSDNQSGTLASGFTYSPPPPPTTSSEIVLYAAEAPVRIGNWSIVADATAAAGSRISNPDAGAAKRVTALANPSDYFELTFNAQSGTDYRLWVRSKAQNDFWGNDSVFIQFSDSVNSSGSAVYRIGTSAAAEMNLEDCSGCGIQGWGWQDNGWGIGVLGPLIRFFSTGSHTIRVQVREDGLSIDQIVLSSQAYLNTAPGALRNDSTILAKTTGGSAPRPNIISISPNSGPTTGGTGITVSGTAFQVGATVSVGGTAASNVTVLNSSSITAITSVHAAGTVDLIVTNPDGQSGSLVQGFTYNPPPLIGTISPTSGPIEGGNSVTISGTGFASGATVSFGGVLASSTNVIGSTSITAAAPAHSASTVDVIVTNPDGQSAIRANSYTYVTTPMPPVVSSITPNSGTIAGGTSITISGSQFSIGAVVTIGGTSAMNVVVANSSTITATTPAHVGGTFDVVVTNTNGQSGVLSNGFTYTSPSEIVLLADDFNDGFLDNSKWIKNALFSGYTDATVPVIETQWLEIGALKKSIDGSHYNGIRSVGSYDFFGAYSYVHLVLAPNSFTSADAFLTIGLDVNNCYRMYVEGSSLVIQKKIGGAKTTLFTSIFNAGNHAFWRIRHDSVSGNVVFETAPANGNVPDNWTQLYAEPWNTASVPLGAVMFELKAGTWKAEVNEPGTVTFDNFRAVRPSSD